jgi:hypothetical protein
MTEPSERIVPAITRRLREFGLEPNTVWAAKHVYTIYNRRFDCMQIIAVYAAEVNAEGVELNPAEHAEYRWCTYEEAHDLVTYRGLKDGLRSTKDYVTGQADPPREAVSKRTADMWVVRLGSPELLYSGTSTASSERLRSLGCPPRTITKSETRHQCTSNRHRFSKRPSYWQFARRLANMISLMRKLMERRFYISVPHEVSAEGTGGGSRRS